MRRFVHAVMLMILLGIAPGAQAILTIEITQGIEGATPIAVVPFDSGGLTTPAASISSIIEAARL